MTQRLTSDITAVLEAAAARVREADVFASAEVEGTRLVAEARGTPSPVLYRIDATESGLAVSWNSTDRYLSQSIESDLMWTGDDLDDLIDEELVDLGWDRGRLGALAHHRDEAMFFTFKSSVPLDVAVLTESDSEDLARCLLAYELAFRELGDMSDDDAADA